MWQHRFPGMDARILIHHQYDYRMWSPSDRMITKEVENLMTAILQQTGLLGEAREPMSRFTRSLTCLLLLLFASTAIAAEDSASRSSVFLVSDGDSELYLAGTVHLLRPSDYPLPEPYRRAYENAGQLYFETDLGQMTDMSMQASMMQELTYQDGRTLEDVLNDEAWQALNDYADEAGVPLAMMRNFKPGLLVSTLSVMEFQRLGFTPQGIDMYFHTRATGEGKEVGRLEELEEQIELLAGMGEGHESEFILYSLEDFQRAAESIEAIVRHWRNGNMDALHRLFVEPMREQSATLYEELLVARNRDWLPTIESLLDGNEPAMVLVGVAHLVGEDGLLEMLEDQGYTVTRY